MASENTNAEPNIIDAKDREIDRLRSVLLDMLYEFESDHETVMEDEHEEDEAKDPMLCKYCRIIAEAHAALEADYSTTQVPQSPAEPPKPLDVGLLMAPNGKRIVGIEEQAIVDYKLLWVERDENGEVTFDYDTSQSSDVSWDSADPTVDENGEYTFYDEDGDTWKESQLVKSTLPPPESDDYDSSKDDWYGDKEEEGEDESEEE